MLLIVMIFLTPRALRQINHNLASFYNQKGVVMKNMRYLLPVFIFSLMTGCGTPAVIKTVEDRPVENLKASENSKPIQLTKIVVKLKRGEHVGALQAGLLCVSQGDLNWKGGRISIDSDEFTDAFKEELEKSSFKTVGDTNALFQDPSTWKSEILVAGLVKELKANICYPMAGFGNFSSSKGEAFIKVDWQIYSKLDRSIIHSVTTEGAAKNTDAVSGGDTVAVLNAFAQASRNLLADSKFREIVSRGGQTVKETSYKSGDSIVVSTGSSKPLSNKPDEWADGVVTVFAGSGHGSGFVISDNLILTNHHVVGESNSVVVKFSSGFQVVGKVIASNSGRDVAIVKVDATLPKHFRVSRAMPAVGADVYAVGSPLDENLHSTVTRGIISGVREENHKTLIQSDVNIRPGNSGGPLIDNDGAVVGIAVSALVVNSVAQGINFFIPIDDALKSLGVI
ncbi:S1C family serine protease [Thauera sp.]|uniref:S1C family serine protease n=1 Tax=Thauera sp. TaxID=1905334 RepID=UPI00262793B2|nr:S1C family serine protease [Thauera sp.]